MARRFGSAMISKTDSTLFVYYTEHIRVKAYTDWGQATFQSACQKGTLRALRMASLGIMTRTYAGRGLAAFRCRK
jgi:hypothetical protein